MLKLYPDFLPGRLLRLLLDLLALSWTAAWALAGWEVYRLVLLVQVVSDAITATGRTFNQWAQDVKNAAPRGVPGLGGALQDLGSALQRSAGDPVIQHGMLAHTRIEQLAVALGLAVAAGPMLIVAGLYGRWRWHDAREMGAAEAFAYAAERSGRIEEAKAALAHRAVATLPFRRLMRTSADPIGDLSAHRYDALAAAMLRQAGVRALR